MTGIPTTERQALDDPRILTGHVFSRVLRVGALAVVREQETLDRINAFPVRDADSGAEFVAARLREHLDGEVPVVRAGAVFTTHVGVGSVSVAVRRRAG